LPEPRPVRVGQGRVVDLRDRPALPGDLRLPDRPRAAHGRTRRRGGPAPRRGVPRLRPRGGRDPVDGPGRPAVGARLAQGRRRHRRRGVPAHEGPAHPRLTRPGRTASGAADRSAGTGGRRRRPPIPPGVPGAPMTAWGTPEPGGGRAPTVRWTAPAGRTGPVDDERRAEAQRLADLADRLDGLAEVADLMGDEAGAARLRSQATARRLRALRLLDD